MQERKNKRLLLLLILMIVFTVILYRIAGRKHTLQADKNIFQLSDYKSIDKVVLQSDADKVILAYNGSQWRVNDRFDADPNMITVLFATLQKATARRPVAASLQDSIGNGVEKSGVKVSLFEGQSVVQSFYAGGNPAKTHAYFKDPQTGKVYLMVITGYRVYVSGIFELTENQWRNKYVFGFNWRNFEGLQAEFPSSPRENFKVARGENNIFGIVGMAQADTAKLNTFLDEVSLLTVNEYLDPGPYTDSLKETSPAMIITISDIARNKYSLKLFAEQGSDVPGLLNENQGALFNRLKIKSIRRPKSWFKMQ